MSKFRAVDPDMAAAFEHQRTYELLGLQSGSVDGVILSSTAATQKAQGGAQDRAKRKAHRQTDDALLLAIFRLGDLDTYVAETFVAGMTDDELQGTISAIETGTGKSFKDYASDILGPDMPTQKVGETDRDYQRHVLTAVTDAILNDDLSIKAGFEHDPLARIIRADMLYQEARDAVATTTSPFEQAAALDRTIDASPDATTDNMSAFASLKP